MKKWAVVDYRGFRLSKVNEPQFSHLKYLLYWPFYGLLFWCIERFWIRGAYHVMDCRLDGFIPFCEYFLITYLFWFVLLAGVVLYGLLFDTQAFKQLMRFIMLTYSVCVLIYILFPNCQHLRPASFARDNVLTRAVQALYRYDTNTNVCPSLHVVGSAAALFCAWHSKHLSTPAWRAFFTAAALLICASTMFLKQHSVLDVLAALPVCAVGYDVVYSSSKRRLRKGRRNHGGMIPV